MKSLKTYQVIEGDGRSIRERNPHSAKRMWAALDIRRENAEQALARIRELKAIIQLQEEEAIRRVNDAYRALQTFEQEDCHEVTSPDSVEGR